ncbi:DNA polymerase beta domain protein region [Ammonifex degensii KC4]|uniref:DNA polymerase beta domain protein region n=1 Tax=Ammonifex degensii (strain DSM 10501 / KC4) TaxID=429009 RepID=C9R9G9_AMMDK|nr:nucleotidyltransferase domain-containing protein [Ammonifex degensii]ACX52948.1 DNA polymerase beta domain protein region [Ammonifex degensii KC4]
MRVTWKEDRRRKRLLLKELNRIISFCPRLKFKKLYVFGSLVRDEVTAGSDLDLLAVQETELPWLERLEVFFREVQPRVAVDILIYTPEELAELSSSRDFVRRILEEGRLVYEEKPEGRS